MKYDITRFIGYFIDISKFVLTYIVYSHGLIVSVYCVYYEMLTNDLKGLWVFEKCFFESVPKIVMFICVVSLSMFFYL